MHDQAWSAPMQWYILSELVGIETERARALGVGEIVLKFLNRQASEFLAIERPYHRFIAVTGVPLDFAGIVDLGCTEVKLPDHRYEVRAFIDRFRDLAFGPPDRRLEHGCLL